MMLLMSSERKQCQHVDFSGSAIWAMIIMIVILTIVMIFFCMVNFELVTTTTIMLSLMIKILFICRVMVTLMMMVMDQVPVYKALEKRWNHWDDLENDPRSSVAQLMAPISNTQKQGNGRLGYLICSFLSDIKLSNKLFAFNGKKDPRFFFLFSYVHKLKRVTRVRVVIFRWNADSFQFSPTSPQMARAGGLSNNK